MKTVLTTHDKELIMLLPSFMALHIERKLSEICREGYRLVEISNAIIGYRFRFSCASPQNRAFYVFAANEHRAAKAGIEKAPGYSEEERLGPLCKRVIRSDGAVLVVELNPDADSDTIRGFSTEKMQSAMTHNVRYLLFWTALFLFAMIGSLFFSIKTAEDIVSMYVGGILAVSIIIYHIVGIAVCCRELRALRKICADR